MASPPYNYSPSISPPYPSHTSLTQAPSKRRQSDLPTSAPSTKRRKASVLSQSSSSSHPLRQTSFPYDLANINAYSSRSPSIETTSLISNSVPSKGKRSSRKSKSAQNDDASISGGVAKSTHSGRSGRGKRTQSRDESEEDDDVGPVNTNVQVGMRTEEERKKEIEHRAILVKAFDRQQFQRYEAWRSFKFPDATIRRLINQTVSQSVPQGVILAIRIVTKFYAGELIELARKVQSQWIEAEERAERARFASLPAVKAEVRNKEGITIGDSTNAGNMTMEDGSEAVTRQGEVLEIAKQKPLEKRRGPLEPEHLREALRRYKLTREGGLAGHLDLWKRQQQSGVERFGTRTLGKRFMR